MSHTGPIPPDPDTPPSEAVTRITAVGPGFSGLSAGGDHTAATRRASLPASQLPSRTPESRTAGAGEVIAGRYRIVTHLGRGGMGDVYRADDLTLGSSVALKFVPDRIAADPERLARFRAEVNITRQISHPNVCRVYDISEADGRVFLSMEYIDGEDLASLLRRIGRLPTDKGVEIARQICFGLAAAHDHGVIHRDIKPANIMIDGRGRARLTDFGIAGLAEDLRARGDIASGTPEYMAPEQFAGREVSKRSDLFALGLVLFELFTGQRALRANTYEDLAQWHRAGATTARPSTYVADLDPAVERVILRCLSPDPDERPSSALAVAAALPGGDPIQAALAAGETPSPELIAASGSEGALSMGKALALAALCLVFLIAGVLATRPVSLFAAAAPEKSPIVLADRARDAIKMLGIPYPAEDAHWGLVLRTSLIQNADTRPPAERLATLRGSPGAFAFWYRQSPRRIPSSNSLGRITLFDPSPWSVGEVCIRTDTAGKLELLAVVIDERLTPAATSTAAPVMPQATTPGSTVFPLTDPTRTLFMLAGLDFSKFTAIEPFRRPIVYTESLAAYRGPMDGGRGESVVHVGLAAGLPVYFHIAFPWNAEPVPFRAEPPPSLTQRVSRSGTTLFVVAIFLAALVLAFRSIRSGRADTRGATRVALFVAMCTALAIVLTAQRLPSIDAVFFQGEMFAAAAWVGGLFWLFYVGLEPYARRTWPQCLVSWTRLTRGGFADPRVGRDVLLGCTAGLAAGAVSMGVLAAATAAGWRTFATETPSPVRQVLESWSGGLGLLPTFVVNGLMFGSGALLTIVLGRLLFKSQAAAVALGGVVLIINAAGDLMTDPMFGVLMVLSWLVMLAVLLRAGLLAGTVGFAVHFLGLLLFQMGEPLGPWSHGFLPPTVLLLLVIAGAAWVACRPLQLHRHA